MDINKRFINTIHEAEGLESPRVTEARELASLMAQQDADRKKELQRLINNLEIKPIIVTPEMLEISYDVIGEYSYVISPADTVEISHETITTSAMSDNMFYQDAAWLQPIDYNNNSYITWPQTITWVDDHASYGPLSFVPEI